MASKGENVTRKLSLMTTSVAFTIETTEIKRANQAIDLAINEFKRIEERFSEWKPDSEISQLNRQAAKRPMRVSNESYRLLRAAYNTSLESDGAFDISFAAVGQLWDFRRAIMPSQDEITMALRSVGYQHLKFDDNQKSIYFKRPGLKIGLGAIAKGYAVDRAAQIFQQQKFTVFSINAGGDLYAAGKTWETGLQDPRNKSKLLAMLPLKNTAVATSGDYERFFILEGERYSHIIDPRTGWPAKDCISVSILAPKVWQADAFATAVFVLGPDKGMQLIESKKELEGIIVTTKGDILLSSSLKQL